MDQRLQGNFIASPTTAARYGQNERRPAYQGKIAIPGTERVFPVSLWTGKYRDKSGVEQTYFNGNTATVSTSDSPTEQIDAIASGRAAEDAIAHKGMNLRPGQVALFANGFKNEPGVDPEKLEKRPDYFGFWNPGNGEQIVQVSAWARKGRGDGVFISGATQYPQPGKELGKDQADERNLQDLVDSGDVTKGMPGKRRAQRDGAPAR